MAKIRNYADYQEVIKEWQRLKKLRNRTGALTPDQAIQYHILDDQLNAYEKRITQRIPR